MTVDTRFITDDALYSMRNVAVAILEEDQRKDEDAYREWVRRAVNDLKRFRWTIAFVSKKHDAQDVVDFLLDTINEKNLWSEQQMREMAEEIVDG